MTPTAQATPAVPATTTVVPATRSRPTSGDRPWGGPGKWHDRVTRVIIAEEAVLLRRRLAVVLGDQPDVEVVADLDDGRALLARAVELVPDVVVLGLTVRPKGAVATIAALRERLPGVEVVVVGPPGDPAATGAVRSGAIAVLPSHAAADRAVAVVGQVARHHPVLPLPVAAGVIADDDRRAGPAGGPELAPAERAAILAVADDGAPLGDDPFVGARRSATARNALERLARHTRDQMVLELAPRPGVA